MIRRLDHALLAFLLLAHLILLSARNTADGSPLEQATFAVMAPVAGAVSGLVENVGGFIGEQRLASKLKRENAALKEDLETMRGEVVRLHGVEEELARVSHLAGYDRPAGGGGFVADVVFADPESWLRTLIIYTGTEPATRNQPVVTDRGLVGRVVVAAGRYAKVLLITDRSAAVSAMIQRTRRQGMVWGDGAHGLLLDNIPLLADVRPGDRVVTAGIDGIFPRGLPLGQVVEVTPGSGLFHRIRVAPAIDLGLLDKVYVRPAATVPEEIRELLAAPAGGEESGAEP